MPEASIPLLYETEDLMTEDRSTWILLF